MTLIYFLGFNKNFSLHTCKSHRSIYHACLALHAITHALSLADFSTILIFSVIFWRIFPLYFGGFFFTTFWRIWTFCLTSQSPLTSGFPPQSVNHFSTGCPILALISASLSCCRLSLCCLRSAACPSEAAAGGGEEEDSRPRCCTRSRRCLKKKNVEVIDRKQEKNWRQRI